MAITANNMWVEAVYFLVRNPFLFDAISTAIELTSPVGTEHQSLAGFDSDLVYTEVFREGPRLFLHWTLLGFDVVALDTDFIRCREVAIPANYDILTLRTAVVPTATTDVGLALISYLEDDQPEVKLALITVPYGDISTSCR